MLYRSPRRRARISTRTAIACAGLTAGLLLLAACGATSSSGGAAQVTIAAGQAQYGVHDQVVVTISNGLPSAVLAADHHSNCTIVTIERQEGQSWLPQNPCLLKTATRLVTLATGSTTTVRLDAPTGTGSAGWAAGTYRLTLTYRMVQSGADTTVASAAFAIG